MSDFITILDPSKAFKSIIESGDYNRKNYLWSLDMDPELEVYEDIANEAVSLYSFYMNRASDYIINETNDLKLITALENFIIDCIADRSAVATIYHSNQLELEAYLEPDDREYKSPSIVDGYLASSISLVDESGNEFFFNDSIDEILDESSKYDTVLRKYIYNQRILNTKELMDIYDEQRESLPSQIKYYYPTLKQYKQNNIFVDLNIYFHLFLAKLHIPSIESRLEAYYTFFTRLISTSAYETEGYNNFNLIIPINGWGTMPTVMDYKKDLNPLSMIYRYIKNKPSQIKEDWKGRKILFFSEDGYFIVDMDSFSPDEAGLFFTNIKRILNKEIKKDPNTMSNKVKTVLAVDKIEKRNYVTINNLTGTSKMSYEELDDKIKNNPSEVDKDAVVDRITTKAGTAKDEDELLDKLAADNNEYERSFEDLIKDLKTADTNGVKLTAARASRVVELNSKFMKSKTSKGETVAESIAKYNDQDELPEVNFPVDSINDEWHHMTSASFNNEYSLESDILAIMAGFGDKDRISKPVSIIEWSVEDTSTSEDYVDTYTFKMETIKGARFTLRYDVPKLINNRFMKLRGNEKTISNQLVLFPVIKTDEDTVQIVSSYNKVFIYRYGNKASYMSDLFIKAANKYTGKNIKFYRGDNSRICSKYDVPIDYIELASEITKIESTKDGAKVEIILNMDTLLEEAAKRKLTVDPNKIPLGFRHNEVIYAYGQYVTDEVYSAICDEELIQLMTSGNRATKYQYSRASILNTDIPVIVICGYLKGLEATLDEANIDYRFTEKRPKLDLNHSVIKFKDAYLEYQCTYESEMLLNGLRDCNTEDYSIIDTTNGSGMWLDFLDLFGGRLRADGLDNFNDLMIDSPITTRICDRLGIPKTFIGCLLYANTLLADNKYNKHTDITGNRFRCGEIIAGYVYKCVAKSYADYSTQFKKTNAGIMTMKQSAVIDAILLDPTSSDLSVLTPLLEAETANSVTFKGLSGMNSDRSYSLDKRNFDSSMLNVLGMSTGFSGNVGITRQTTIDPNIVGSGGFIKTTGVEDSSITKTFTYTEAIVPMGSTRDDPARVAMTFVQTAKHNMPTNVKTPMLVSSGADQAIAYSVTDTYAHKAKGNGSVIEKTDEYMIVEYKGGDREYIDLSPKVYKNSDGGFYVLLQNTTNLNEKSTFKEGEIIAYDKNSFDGSVGPNDNLAYTSSTLAKVAILTTDDGFEDSCIISEWLSEALASDVIVKVPISLDKNANVYSIVSKGDNVLEGDPLLIFQNAFSDEDANMIIKNIGADEELEITEIGRIPIRSKITGVVQDINIYRTVDTDELSDSLKKVVTKYEKEINSKKAMMKKNKVAIPLDMPSTETLPATGKLKNSRDGVLIEFYLLYHDKMSIGDKLTYFSALKGVVKDTFPKGKEPYTDFRKNEKIHTFLSLSSINGRMVTSPINIAPLNKIMVELGRACKDIYGIKWESLEDTLLKID